MCAARQKQLPIDIKAMLFQSLDVIPIPVLVSSSQMQPAGRRLHLFINRAFSAQIGYDVQDMPEMADWFTLAYPDPRYRQQVIQNWQQAVTQALAQGHNVAEMSALVQCKSGAQRWFIISAQLHAEVIPEWHIVTFRDVHDLHSMMEQNRILSITDSLTQLVNRREAQRQLELAMAAFHHHGQTFSLLLADIDHFKQLNDRFGHQCGDAALRQVAAALQQIVRDGDCVARWGGEEFLLLLPATALADALLIAERIRATIAGTAQEWDGAPHLTISLGCAQVQPGHDLDQLICQADAALYRAKQGGRNRVCH